MATTTLTTDPSAEPARKPLDPARRRRVAARAVIGGVLLFVALQLGLTIVSHTCYPELRDPAFWTKVCRFQERLHDAAPRPFSVIMLGSSCTAYGFRGRIVEEELSTGLHRPVMAFNFGVYGRGPLSSLLHLQRLVEAGLKPDVALIEVFSLVLPKYTPPHDANPACLAYGELATARRFHSSANLESEWWKSCLAPVSGQRKAILSGVAPHLLPMKGRMEWWEDMDESGWFPLPGQVMPVAGRDYNRSRKDWRRKLKNFSVEGEAAAALEAVLEYAADAGVRVILVSIPEGPPVRRDYPAGLELALDGFLTELSRKHAVPVINARRWLAEADFSDSYHQYPAGAARFSTRLAHELRPLLETPP